MKRKALIAVLCMVMSVSIINMGCSGNTSKKEEKHTTETNNKGNKDTEEKTSEKSSEKTEKDTKKNVKYEYGITNLDSVEYVKDPSVPEVGEDGNPMNVPTDILGYYTNGNVGYDIREINGALLIGDIIEYQAQLPDALNHQILCCRSQEHNADIGQTVCHGVQDIGGLHFQIGKIIRIAGGGLNEVAKGVDPGQMVLRGNGKGIVRLAAFFKL